MGPRNEMAQNKPTELRNFASWARNLDFQNEEAWPQLGAAGAEREIEEKGEIMVEGPRGLASKMLKAKRKKGNAARLETPLGTNF